MSADGEYTWRPITSADVDGWARLLAAVEAADRIGEHVGTEQLAEHFGNPDRDFPRGSLAAFEAAGQVEGEMAGFSCLRARPTADPVHEFALSGAVHPTHRGRGLGTRLLNWAETASVPLHEERFPGRPLTLGTGTLVGDTASEQLFADLGYRQVRWFHTMRLDLSRALPDSPLAEGVTLRSFTPERSEDGRLIRNEAFRDHWGTGKSSVEGWARVTAGRSFRPGLTFVAYEGDEPLSLVLSEEHEAHQRVTGSRDLYIGLVGTRRIGRRRGLASALLTHVLQLARADGFDTASLGVDADSPTGALGLYERLGFRQERTWAAQQKPLITVALPA